MFSIAESEQQVSPTMLISLRLRKRRTNVSRRRRFSAMTYTLVGEDISLPSLCMQREPPPLSLVRSHAKYQQYYALTREVSAILLILYLTDASEFIRGYIPCQGIPPRSTPTVRMRNGLVLCRYLGRFK